MNRKELLERKAETERNINYFRKELEFIEKELNKSTKLIVPLHIQNPNFVDNQVGLRYNVCVEKRRNDGGYWLQTAEATEGLNICMSPEELAKVREAIDIVLGE